MMQHIQKEMREEFKKKCIHIIDIYGPALLLDIVEKVFLYKSDVEAKLGEGEEKSIDWWEIAIKIREAKKDAEVKLW